jgi:hypothetical protein
MQSLLKNPNGIRVALARSQWRTIVSGSLKTLVMPKAK